MSSRFNPSRGFTLIELLVVIAIVAILAAILFPVMNAVKGRAMDAQCLSNMHQVGHAGLMYLLDYDQTWFPAIQHSDLPGFAPQRPWIGYDNNNSPPSSGLYGDDTKPATHPIRVGLIDSYLKDESAKRCPDSPAGAQLIVALNFWTTGTASNYYLENPTAADKEYGPSSWKVEDVDGSGIATAIGISDTFLQAPGETLMAWEHLFPAPLCNFLQAQNWFSEPPYALKSHFNPLHHEGTTTVWCDGHVKWMLFAGLRRPMFSCIKDIYR